MDVGNHQQIKNSRFSRWLGSRHSRSKCCPIYTRLIFLCAPAWLTSGEKKYWSGWTVEPLDSALSCFASEYDNREQQFLTCRNNKRVEFWAHKTRHDVHKHISRTIFASRLNEKPYWDSNAGLDKICFSYFIDCYLILLCIISWPLESLETKPISFAEKVNCLHYWFLKKRVIPFWRDNALWRQELSHKITVKESSRTTYHRVATLMRHCPSLSLTSVFSNMFGRFDDFQINPPFAFGVAGIGPGLSGTVVPQSLWPKITVTVTNNTSKNMIVITGIRNNWEYFTLTPKFEVNFKVDMDISLKPLGVGKFYIHPVGWALNFFFRISLPAFNCIN